MGHRWISATPFTQKMYRLHSVGCGWMVGWSLRGQIGSVGFGSNWNCDKSEIKSNIVTSDKIMAKQRFGTLGSHLALSISGIVTLADGLVPVEAVETTHVHGLAVVADVVAFAFDSTGNEGENVWIVVFRAKNAVFDVGISSGGRCGS